MINCKNPTLLNVTYLRQNKHTEQKECFRIIYLDDNNNVHYSDEPPMADIYIVKPEYRNFNYTKPQERIDHMDKFTVKVSDIRKTIAHHAGEWGENILRDAFTYKDFKLMDKLYSWPYAYGCDFQPEFYFYNNWYKKYPQPNPKLSKAFLDIEIDAIDYSIDLSNLKYTSHAPVNCVTVVLSETEEVYTFILSPQKPNTDDQERLNLYYSQLEQHNKIINDLSSFYDLLHKEFDPVYGKLKYQLRYYNKEIELIADIFRLLNTKKPHFCLMWNMRFDIQYLYYRIIELGYDPKSIMCHPDFKNPNCYFKEDKSTYQLEKQYDFFYCSSYTQYICQLRNFSAIRKSQHKLRSMKLNYISDMILKDKKVDYPEDTSFRLFPYKDWLWFIVYNLKDSLLIYKIEEKTNDLMTYYMRAHANYTTYNKIFRETTLLRNVREMYFEKEGYIQSNNINILEVRNKEDNIFYDNDEEEGTSFKGAIVADPLMNDDIGELLLGLKTNNIFRNAMDFDMGAFYPSIKISNNIDPATLLFKASFINEEFINGEMSNKSLSRTYEEIDKNGDKRKLDITGEAVNTYVSGNNLTFGFNYLNIPSISEIYNKLKSREG